jgi:sortase A
MAARSRLTLAAALILALAGALQFGHGAWIYAKAQLAQVLIENAWQRRLAGEPAPKPWPWADTSPVARLEAPAQGVRIYVLAGSSGRTLAFGPGHQAGTPNPGERGNSVIGGHRDTHLSFLRDVKRGELMRIERPDGVWVDYRVTELDVLDRRETWVLRDGGGTRLTLVTCWPFDALAAGGPERYVVIAEAIEPSLPLDRGWRLGRDVIGDAVDAAHLVDDAVGDLGQKLMRQLRPFGRHEVGGLHRAQRHDVFVGPDIAHHAYGANR